MANNENYALSWDSVIQDGPETMFVLLEEGSYPYTITKLERQQYKGSEKVEPCPRAVITLEIQSPDGGIANITDRIDLYSRNMWKIRQFFTSIGQRKRGEDFTPNWNKVVGATGRVQIGQRTYTGDDGKEHTANSIVRYLEPVDNTPTYGNKKPWQK